MRRPDADMIVALIAVVIGGGTLLLVPFQVKGESLGALLEVQSPAFFPILAALIMLLNAVVLLVQVIGRDREAGLYVRFDRPLDVLYGIGVMVGFVAATPWIGMTAASAIAILALGLFMEPRRWKAIVLTAVIVPVAIYLLFERLLLILLPEGTLF